MIKNCEICGKPYEGDGRSKFCSDECRTENKKINRHKYYQENRKRILGHQKKYYQKNRTQILIYQKKYWKSYYQEHREQLLERNKKYQQEHKDYFKEYHKLYAQRRYDKNWNCGIDCFSCPHPDCIY